MKQQGTVTEATDKSVTVCVIRRSACEGCKQKTSCVGGCDDSKSKPIFVTVENTLGASVGDTVTLSSPDGFVLSTAFLLFVFPLLTSIAAIAAAQSAGLSEGYVYLFAAVAFALPFFVVLFIANRRAKSGKYLKLTAVSEKAEEKKSEQ